MIREFEEDRDVNPSVNFRRQSILHISVISKAVDVWVSPCRLAIPDLDILCLVQEKTNITHASMPTICKNNILTDNVALTKQQCHRSNSESLPDICHTMKRKYIKSNS